MQGKIMSSRSLWVSIMILPARILPFPTCSRP